MDKTLIGNCWQVIVKIRGRHESLIARIPARNAHEYSTKNRSIVIKSSFCILHILHNREMYSSLE